MTAVLCALDTDWSSSLCSAGVHIPHSRVGLLCTDGSVSKTGVHICKQLQANGFTLVAAFTPEHDANWCSDEAFEAAPQQFAAYGAGLDHIPPTALENLACVFVDLPDVGTRYYTYTESLRLLLQASARSHTPIVVFDRPNPLGGLIVEGPIVRQAFRSWSGYAPITVRHGMTIGELALLINNGFSLRGETVEPIGAPLTVLPCEGWKREMHFDDCAMPWHAPSPNMIAYESALLYPGTCLFEGTNFSEGRGSSLPFQCLGYPGINAESWKTHALENFSDFLEGVELIPTSFTPISSKCVGVLCQGLMLNITSRNALQPFRAGLALLSSAFATMPEQIHFLPAVRPLACHFDLLIGNDEWRRPIAQPPQLRSLLKGVEMEERDFATAREDFLLY